jgi:hypothetical protein
MKEEEYETCADCGEFSDCKEIVTKFGKKNTISKNVCNVWNLLRKTGNLNSLR